MDLAIDGVIVAMYFVAITGIGLYMGRRERSLEDFALGGRRMPWWAVMASIIAAETSAATFLAVPSEGFVKRSIVYVQLAYGVILGRIIVGYVFLKPYYEYRVYTVYDFLKIRFGPMTKGYVSALFLVMRTLAMGTRLFIPALVMVLAWRMMWSGGGAGGAVTVREYVVAIVAMTVITCAYTAVGGIKAVIWTDVIQATLMFGSAIVAIVTLLYHIGGDSWNLMEGVRAVGRAVPEMAGWRGYVVTGFEGVGKLGVWGTMKGWLTNEYALPSAVLAYTVMCVGVYGTDQDLVQRMLTAPDYKKSRRSLIVAALMDLPIFAGFALIGVLLVAFYRGRPDLKPAATADVFSQYILKVMPVGVRGVVLAGVFATAMGSLSAALNALATSLTNDWYVPYVGRGKGEGHYVAAARVSTVVFAALMITVAGVFAYAKVHHPGLRIIPVVLGVAGSFIGPMLGVFLIGMLTKRRGSDRGNMLAITLGLGAAGWVAAGTDVKFTWFGLVGSAVVFAVGVLFRTPERVVREAEVVKEEAHGASSVGVG